MNTQFHFIPLRLYLIVWHNGLWTMDEEMESELWTCLKYFRWFFILNTRPHICSPIQTFMFDVHASTQFKWNDDHPKSNSNGKNYSIPKWQIESHISFYFSFRFFWGGAKLTFYSKLSNVTYVIYYHKIHRYLIYNMENGIDFCVKFICHRKKQNKPFNFVYYTDFGFGYYLHLTLNQARHWDANMV